jgi:hypothetical protein
MEDKTMTVNLLDNADAAASPAAAPAQPAAAPSAEPVARPEHIPEKFWDAGKGEPRTEALARSYAELEKKLGTGAGVPADPSGYRIETRDEAIAADAEVNARLHKAGFTQAQAQLVYDLAADKLLPMIGEIAARFEADAQTERLARHFGGEARWHELSRQIGAWGRANLPQSAFDALSATYEGVVAMHRMMTTGEPGLVRGETAHAAVSLDSLRELMRNPRYWRDHDPVLHAQVADGFKRLYPGKA